MSPCHHALLDRLARLTAAALTLALLPGDRICCPDGLAGLGERIEVAFVLFASAVAWYSLGSATAATACGAGPGAGCCLLIPWVGILYPPLHQPSGRMRGDEPSAAPLVGFGAPGQPADERRSRAPASWQALIPAAPDQPAAHALRAQGRLRTSALVARRAGRRAGDVIRSACAWRGIHSPRFGSRSNTLGKGDRGGPAKGSATTPATATPRSRTAAGRVAERGDRPVAKSSDQDWRVPG